MPSVGPVGLPTVGVRPEAVKSVATVLLVLAVLQVAAGPWLMSLGTDEAWALNGLRSLLTPRTPDLSTELVSSNGGLFAITSLFLEWVAPGSVVAHKLMSALCLFGAWLVSLRLVQRVAIPQTTRGWAVVVISPLLVIPGLVEVGTAALGTSCAVLLLVASVSIWTDIERSNARRVFGAGVLFGLAVGSRLDVMLFAPAFFVSTLLPGSSTRTRRDWSVVPMLAVAGALIALNDYSQTFSAVSLDSQATAGARGFANWTLDYPKLLNQFSTGLGLLSPAVAAVIVLATWWPKTPTVPAEEAGRRRQRQILQAMLLVGGVCMGLGWLFRAPIPHLRYLWPTLFCFALLGSLVMARLVEQAVREADARRTSLCYGFACVAMIAALVGNARALINADTDVLSWEWSHETSFDYFRRFVARSDQASAAQFVAGLDPASTTVYSSVPFPLRYLAQRAVVDMVDATAVRRSTPSQSYIVLTPINGTFIEMSTDGRQWISENTKLVAQFGRYSIYRVDRAGVAPPASVIPRRTSYSGHPLSQNWFGR